MTDGILVKVGDHAEFEKAVTSEDIALFAQVSGDTNPLHSDAEYAAKTRFGECIAHGMLTAGFNRQLWGRSWRRIAAWYT